MVWYVCTTCHCSCPYAPTWRGVKQSRRSPCPIVTIPSFFPLFCHRGCGYEGGVRVGEIQASRCCCGGMYLYYGGSRDLATQPLEALRVTPPQVMIKQLSYCKYLNSLPSRKSHRMSVQTAGPTKGGFNYIIESSRNNHARLPTPLFALEMEVNDRI